MIRNASARSIERCTRLYGGAKRSQENSAKRRFGARREFQAVPLEKYAGSYSDPWYGAMSIKVEGSNLVFRLTHTPEVIADLQHWQNDTFKAYWRDRSIEDAFLTFTLKPDGAISHFTLQAVSPLADFSFDYQDLWVTPVSRALH